MYEWLKKKTVKPRHFVVKTITPRFYNEAKSRIDMRECVSSVPRPMIKFVKKELRGQLVGAEIGVAYGQNAENILKELNIQKIFLIDPYVPFFREGKVVSYKKAESEAEKRLKEFADKTIFIKKLSSDAVDLIPDNLDFVYIDGNHEYEYVKEDIANYYPKVRKGGVMGGHDFGVTEWFGVAKATVEFAIQNNLELQVEPYDWWIIKPTGASANTMRMR